jgi:hypothetical protein
MESRTLDINPEKFATQIVDDLYRRNPDKKDMAIMFSFRYDLDYYPPENKKEKHREAKLFFSILYVPGGYTKVFYRADTMFTSRGVEGTWEMVGDHDSCWRDNLDKARKALWDITDRWKTKYNIDPNQVMKFSSVESISEFRVIEYRANQWKQGKGQSRLYKIIKHPEFNQIIIVGSDYRA